MIGLDTNVQVRHIIQDDVAQSKQASDLMDALSADAPGFIGLVGVVKMGKQQSTENRRRCSARRGKIDAKCLAGVCLEEVGSSRPHTRFVLPELPRKQRRSMGRVLE